MSKYSAENIVTLLDMLLSYGEQTWIEFKQNNANAERIARYISALSNMAAAESRSFAYLIWGIDDTTHDVIGTTFDPMKLKTGNQLFKIWLKTQLKPEISAEFYEVVYKGKRVVLLEVEPAYRQPITVNGVAWGRVGESLVELNKLPKAMEKIFRTIGKDWSSEVVLQATCEDLDPEAVKCARINYAEKHQRDRFYNEIEKWDDITFLNKAKLAIDGKLTRAAILLLGKSESLHLISPAVAKITWRLLDDKEQVVDYRHFEPPFILAVNDVFAMIRNVTIRTMPDKTLFPIELSQYDSWVLREALHNCIAHQNYNLCCSIMVSEYPDRIQISNAGAFLPGTIENVLQNNGRPRFYPNRMLTDAMVELNMIDTIGSGIQRMFTTQQHRYMPMPEYFITEEEVSVVLYGKILDLRYTKLLMEQSELSLTDVILLDKLQKGQKIDRNVAKQLRKRGLIEGRYPNVYPAAEVSVAVNDVGTYLENKGYDDVLYMQMISNCLCLRGSMTKAEIRELIFEKLPTNLTDEQKERKLGNLLSAKMRKLGLIENHAGTGHSMWSLTELGMQHCRQNNPKCTRKCSRKFKSKKG